MFLSRFQKILSIFFLYRAVSELAEALRDSDDVKKQGNEWAKENKDLRERLEALEKEIRIKSLQPRSPGNVNTKAVKTCFFLELGFWSTANLGT